MQEILIDRRQFHFYKWITFLLPLTIFVLPFSSTAKSIVFPITLIAIVLRPDFNLNIKPLFKTSLFKYSFTLCLLVLVASLWSPAWPGQKLFVIEKFCKFLYLPFLIVGFYSEKIRIHTLNALIASMCLVCSISIIKYHGGFSSFNFDPDNIFRNHIMTGIMVAFAAYLSALFFFQSKILGKLVYGIVIALLSYQQLFINGSRTGYVLFLLLSFILCLQTFSWRKIGVAFSILSFICLFAYWKSPVMRTGIYDVVHQLRTYQQDKNTNVGLRIQFHAFAYELFKRHPIKGNGTASYMYLYDVERPIVFRNKKFLEPHSFYWLLAAEYGLIGLGVFAFLMFSFFAAIMRLNKMKPIAIALMAVFLIGNLSDSLLFYSGTGYFFIILLALCLSESYSPKEYLYLNEALT